MCVHIPLPYSQQQATAAINTDSHCDVCPHYQHRYDGSVCGGLVQFSCYQHGHEGTQRGQSPSLSLSKSNKLYNTERRDHY